MKRDSETRLLVPVMTATSAVSLLGIYPTETCLCNDPHTGTFTAEPFSIDNKQDWKFLNAPKEGFVKLWNNHTDITRFTALWLYSTL